MWKRHRFEFFRTWISMTIIAIFLVAAYFIHLWKTTKNIIAIVGDIQCRYEYRDEKLWKIKCLNNRKFLIWSQTVPLSDEQKSEIWLFWIMQFPQLFFCFIIIVLKSSKDIIQGISILDYLYKLSSLQIYKNQGRRHQKENIYRIYFFSACY